LKKLLDNILFSAWLPLTPRGVAAFARAKPGRLLLIQFLVAVLTAVSVVWFLNQAWLPVVSEAIGQLPAEGQIRRSQLTWRGDSPVRLAGNRFLSLAVDLWHEGNLGNESDLSLELGRVNARIRSLLGYTECPYPADWTIALNRAELEPWWGARQPWLLAGAAAATVLGLLLSWALLATIYSLPVWLLAFFTNRDLNWCESRRLAGAALMPGALIMTLAMVAYGLGLIDLVKLGAGLVFHFLVGWLYLFFSTLFLPRGTLRSPKNPFATAS
jgi:hypothetical protein